MTREKLDAETYYLIVARDTDKNGAPRCLNCNAKADDVHEIFPRSYWGPNYRHLLFAESNRCCLCRECHRILHNHIGRRRLLFLMQEKHGYTYEGVQQCLLDEYMEDQ